MHNICPYANIVESSGTHTSFESACVVVKENTLSTVLTTELHVLSQRYVNIC